jgi:hypothetical protein
MFWLEEEYCITVLTQKWNKIYHIEGVYILLENILK